MTDLKTAAEECAREIIREVCGPAAHDVPHTIIPESEYIAIIQRAMEQEMLGFLNHIDHLRAELAATLNILQEALPVISEHIDHLSDMVTMTGEVEAITQVMELRDKVQQLLSEGDPNEPSPSPSQQE